MRNLAANQRTIYWSKSLGVETDAVDAYGYYTGEKEEQFSEPERLRINVSTARGEADRDAFGIFEDYDRTLFTTNMNCPLDIETRIWFGADPETEPYNYIVVRVGDSKNVKRYAIKKVAITR